MIIFKALLDGIKVSSGNNDLFMLTHYLCSRQTIEFGI